MTRAPPADWLRLTLQRQLAQRLQEAFARHPALHEDRTQQLLQQLQRRSILLCFDGWRSKISLRVESAMIGVDCADVLPPADVTLAGSISRFVDLLRVQRTPGHGAVAKGMVMSGDLHLAQTFQHLLQHLQPDWEDWLAQHIGDTPAHHGTRLFKSATRLLQRRWQDFQQDLAEYARDEAHLLAVNEGLIHFGDAVGQVRQRVEQLQQRVQRLQNTVKS